MRPAAVGGSLIIAAEGLKHCPVNPLNSRRIQMKVSETDPTQVKDEILGNLTDRMQLSVVPGLSQSRGQGETAAVGELRKGDGDCLLAAMLGHPSGNAFCNG